MFSFLNKFKIPTILGLSILILGTGAGVFLVVLGNQTLTTKASPDQIPKNITFSNITDTSAVVSWITTASVTSFVTFGIATPSERTVTDDSDTKSLSQKNIHYITMSNLTPLTNYQLKIFSGKLVYPQILKFTTAAPVTNQNGYQPVIGSVLQNNKPLEQGIAYLSIAGANTQSALIKNKGNFIIPINTMQKEDLSAVFLPGDNVVAKITIITNTEQTVSTESIGNTTAVFKLANSIQSIGVLKIGENLDLITNPIAKQKEVLPVSQDLLTFDLNNDGLINTSDYSIVLRNFGKKPKEKQTDLNQDSIVDKKDLDIISQKINQQQQQGLR